MGHRSSFCFVKFALQTSQVFVFAIEMSKTGSKI